MTATEQSPLNLDPLEKAVDSLRDALAQPKDPYTRDAAIQRFESTVQIACKTLRCYLATETAIEPFNVKDVFRHAGRQDIIANVETWFAYLRANNMAPFTDSDDTYRIAVSFLTDADALLNEMKRRCGTLGQ